MGIKFKLEEYQFKTLSNELPIDNFLSGYFPSIKKIEKHKLPGDGGHRVFMRIKAEEQNFILMSCGANDPSLKNFIEIQKRLKPFVAVPRIFHKDIQKGLILIEDLGDQTLENAVLQKGLSKVLPLYYQSLKELICIQDKILPLKTDIVFNKDFFLKENETALYHLETYICKNSKKDSIFKDKDKVDFKKNMEKIISKFKTEDYVHCHRDYHSRNLMVKENVVFLIDFQDAGIGPWYYDLTSLIYDSYISLSPSMKKSLCKFYFENLPLVLKKKAYSLSHIEYMTKLQFLQRGFKACGCFAGFKNKDNKTTHLKFIQPTLKLLKQEALECSQKNIAQYITRMLDYV